MFAATKTSGRTRRVLTGIFALFVGLELLYVALNIAIWTGFGVESLLFVLLGLLLLFAGILSFRGKKNPEEKTERKSYPQNKTSHATEKTPFSFREEHHEHIVSTGLSKQRRMEQLKALYEAGLYNKEEYEAEKDKILSRKGTKL